MVQKNSVGKPNDITDFFSAPRYYAAKMCLSGQLGGMRVTEERYVTMI